MADSRGPRLFTDLNNVFKRDPSIDEYDILHVLEPTHNRSPFLLQEHKLGVEAWAVRVLMKYAVTRLIGWRSHNPTLKFIELYEVLNLTRAVLLFNPDNYTAWNIRKELVENGFLPVTEDLTFGALILSKHPKSAETFIHRRWLFQQLLEHCLSSSLDSNSGVTTPGICAESSLNMDLIDVDIVSAPVSDQPLNIDLSLKSSRLFQVHTQLEMEVCSKAAERYPCNYHAWSHRIWLIQHCLNCSIQVLLSELKKTEYWTSRHISDHSGFHYRQFLLSELLKRESKLASFSLNSNQLFGEEMAYVCDLMQSYPGHEALWYHRRFLFNAVLNTQFLNTKLLTKANGFKSSLDFEEDNNLRRQKSLLITQEIDFVNSKHMVQLSDIHQLLAKRYVQWLQALMTTV